MNLFDLEISGVRFDQVSVETCAKIYGDETRLLLVPREFPPALMNLPPLALARPQRAPPDPVEHAPRRRALK